MRASSAAMGGLGPPNMPPPPQQQQVQQPLQEGSARPKLTFRAAALKVAASSSAVWLMKRGAPPPPPKLTLDEKEQIQEAFDMLDEDGSGNVGLDEMITAYALIGVHLTKAAALELVAEVDADGSGEIEFDEFRSLMGQALHPKDNNVTTSGNVPVLNITDMVMALRRKKMLHALEEGGAERAKLVARANQMVATASRQQSFRRQQSSGTEGMAAVRNLMAKLANGNQSGAKTGTGANHSQPGPQKLGIMDVIMAAKRAKAEEAGANDSTPQPQGLQVTEVPMNQAVTAAALGTVAAIGAAPVGLSVFPVQTALCGKGRLQVSSLPSTACRVGVTLTETTGAAEGACAAGGSRSASPVQHSTQQRPMGSSTSSRSHSPCCGVNAAGGAVSCSGDSSRSAEQWQQQQLFGQDLWMHAQQHWSHTRPPYTAKVKEMALAAGADGVNSRGAAQQRSGGSRDSGSGGSSSGSHYGAAGATDDQGSHKLQLSAVFKELQQKVPEASFGRLLSELSGCKQIQ